MTVFVGFKPRRDLLDPINGGGIPRNTNHWNDLFAATFGNESLEKDNGKVDCLECQTPNCDIGAACPNCDVVVI